MAKNIFDELTSYRVKIEKDGKEIKRVTSDDDGNIEDPENENGNVNGNENGNVNGNGNQDGGGDNGGGTGGDDQN